jgi:protein kinase C substrate 80K-H
MRAVVALLLLLFSCRLGWGAIVRGVQPELAAKYEPNADKKWSCLDGSKTIDFDRVNDLYCDCPDGSDEPGAP